MNSKNQLDILFSVDNYLYFNYDNYLTEEKTNSEVSFLLKNLQIDKKKNMLDLACGHGRHSIALSYHLKNIIGIDINESFINIAKETKLPNTSFYVGDIRNIEYNNKFDNVILLNTVFGLFSDDDNISLLNKVNQSLKKNGIFCFDIINRDTLLANFHDSSIVEKDTNNFMLDKLSFDQISGRAYVKRTYIKNMKFSSVNFSIRIYNYTEIAKLVHNAGFEILAAYDGWNDKKVNNLSKKIVLVLKKI